jgi:hypothetical protein
MLTYIARKSNTQLTIFYEADLQETHQAEYRQLAKMSFPVLFTIDGASRHELLLLPSSTTTLKSLNTLITASAASSPNCTEFMSKFKKNDDSGPKEQIAEIKVKWCAEGRDMKIWPATTVITEENVAAVLAMVERGAGRDVVAVKMEKV